MLTAYNQIIQDQIKMGIVERVDEHTAQVQQRYYIPHHCVLKPGSSTTKIRIVYDASAKTRTENASLNECLHRGPLKLPDLCGMLVRFHVLQTDASGSGLGAVLLQIEKDGERRPIAYASLTLSSTEQKYSNIKRDPLAVFYGVTKFRQYLLGKNFPVETDHHPLLKLLGQNEGVPCLVSYRLQRFILKLSAYDYSICCIAGKSNAVSDFLSPKPIPDPQVLEDLEEASMLFIEEEVLDARTIAAETQNDPVLKKALHCTVHGWPSRVSDTLLQPYFLKRWELPAADDT